MGWIESAPYFYAVSETGHNVAEQYVNVPMGSRPAHKFLLHTQTSVMYVTFPNCVNSPMPPLKYLVDVYVDNFIGLAILTSKQQLNHVTNGIMSGIHDVFQAHKDTSQDPISLKNVMLKDGAWDIVKEILGFGFDGADKTMWLADRK